MNGTRAIVGKDVATAGHGGNTGGRQHPFVLLVQPLLHLRLPLPPQLQLQLPLLLLPPPLKPLLMLLT